MSTFITDRTLQQALILDDVRLLQFYYNKEYGKQPYYIRMSIDSLKKQRSEVWLNNLEELSNLPKIIPIIMNGNGYRSPDGKKKDLRFKEKGFSIAHDITEASIKAILQKCLRPGWTESLNDHLKDNQINQKVMVPEATTDMSHDVVSDFNRIKVTENNDRMYIMKKKLTRLRENMSKNQENSNHTWYAFSMFKKDDMIYNGWFIILTIMGKKFLFNYDYLLLLTDLIIMRYNTLELCLACNQIKDHNIPDISVIKEIFHWFDDLLTEYGNDAYKIFKSFEAICIGTYQQLYEKTTACKTLLGNLKKEFDPVVLPKIEQLICLIESCENSNQIFEIFGLFRFGGHPLVDETQGCIKFKNLTKSEIPTDKEGMNKCFGYFIREFIKNYIKENRMWPSIDIERTRINLESNGLKSKRFCDYLQKSSLTFTYYDKETDFFKWACIKFNKLFEYNDFPDFTELISDTSISSPQDCFLSTYSRECMPENTKFCLKRAKNRRTLMAILQEKDFNLKKIRETFESGNIPENWRIIGLHSKERELKVEPRLFAMFCVELRMLFAGMEKNLAEGIFKYIKIQTMTMSESQLNDKLSDMTNPNKHQDYIPYLIAMDMEKFNQRWRVESLIQTQEFLNDIYGVKCYSQSMYVYHVSYLYLSSRFHPPSYLESDFERDGINFYKEIDPSLKHYRSNFHKFSEKNKMLLDTATTWYGQLGGTEGTMQKLWTLAVGQPILYTQHQTGLNSTQIGQGDNQNVLILIKKPDLSKDRESNIIEHDKLISDKIRMYIETLRENLSHYGMILKIEETYVNNYLLTYGKDIIILGCYATSMLKRYSRTLPQLNEPYPTMDSIISSIYSNCHSTSNKSFESAIAYFFAIRETLDYIELELSRNKIKYKSIYERFIHNDDKDIELDKLFFTGCVLLGKDFGGFPIMSFTDMMYRGHPDGLTSYLAWINLIKDYIPVASRIIEYISSLRELKPAKDLLPLIMDPTCINWYNEAGTRTEGKRLLEDFLNESVNNKDIKALFAKNSENDKNKMVEYLSSIEPCFPRGLNEIFRQTPQGVLLEFLSMFTDMRTIKEALPREEAKLLMEVYRTADEKRLKAIEKVMRSCLFSNMENKLPDHLKDWKCTADIADYMRQVSFGREIIGSTMPHPIEQMTLFKLENNQCLRCNCKADSNAYIYFKINPMRKVDFFHKRGPLTIYNGSATREKRAKSVVNFTKKDKSLFGCQRIARISDWISEPNSNLSKFLESLIQSRTDVDLQTIKLSAGKNYGGSAIHRFQDVVLSHACRPNSRPNSSSNIYLSSDTMGPYSKGKENYRIMFQACILYGFALLNLINFFNNGEPDIDNQVYHLHLTCYNCTKPVEDIKLESESRYPKLPKISNCKLIFSSVTDLETKLSINTTRAITLVNPEDIDDNVQSIEIAIMCSAIIIYESICQSISPLYLSTYEIDKDNYKISLTIDDVIKLDIIRILKLVGAFWFLDNFLEIITMGETCNIDIIEMCNTLLYKVPNKNFRYLFDLILVDDVLIKIYDKKHPLSSNFNVDGRGLKDSIIKIMVEGIQEAFLGKIDLMVIIPHKSISMIRLIKMFFVNTIVTNIASNDDISKVKEYVSIIEKHRRRNSDMNKVDIGNWINDMLTFFSFKEDMILFMHDNSIVVSSCGPEAWIKYGKDKISNQGRLPMCYFPISRGSNFDYMKVNGLKSVMKKLPTPFSILFNRSYNIDDHFDEEILPSVNRVQQKMRFEHQLRLTGEYSTAHYKYIDILYYLKVIGRTYDASVNVCEGVAGLGDMCHKLFDTHTCFYNNLLDITQMSPHRGVNYIPAAVLNDVIKGELIIKGVDICLNSGGDFTDNDVVQYYIDEVAGLEYPVILTCDAETSGGFDVSTAMKICENFIKVIRHSKPKSVAIMKTFHNNVKKLMKQINLFFNVSEKVHFVISNFSSDENSECFIAVERENNLEPIKGMDCSISYNIDLKNINSRIRNLIDDFPLLGDMRDRLIMLGFRDNFSNSICTLVGELNNTEPRVENIYEYNEKSRQKQISYLKMRIKMISKEVSDYSRLEKLMKKSNPADSRDIELSCVYYFNTLLLDKILKGINWINMFSENYSFNMDGETIYIHTPDKMSWEKRFLRSLRHVEGHIYCRQHIVTKLPRSDTNFDMID